MDGDAMEGSSSTVLSGGATPNPQPPTPNLPKWSSPECLSAQGFFVAHFEAREYRAQEGIFEK